MQPISVGIRRTVRTLFLTVLPCVLCTIAIRPGSLLTFRDSESRSLNVNGSVAHMEYLTRVNSVPIASPNIQNGKPDLRFVRWHREERFSTSQLVVGSLDRFLQMPGSCRTPGPILSERTPRWWFTSKHLASSRGPGRIHAQHPTSSGLAESCKLQLLRH